MNLPNAITMLRFLLIPFYLIVFFSNMDHHMLYAILILLLAGFTDVLDGYLARKHGQITELGIVLDPLADKLTMLAVFISLIISHEIPDVLAGIILARELGMILVSAIFHFRGKKTVPATVWGKSTTVLYYVSIIAVMFAWPFAVDLLAFTVILSAVTSLVYLSQFRLLNQTLADNAQTPIQVEAQLQQQLVLNDAEERQEVQQDIVQDLQRDFQQD